MKQQLPTQSVLNSVINFAKKCFTKPQFVNFKEYVGGIISAENKTITGISDASVRKHDQSSLNRFLTSSTWDEKLLERRYLKKVNHEFGKNPVTLIIDDSLAKKTGKEIDEVQYHKDHSGKGFVWGHQLVTALVKSREKVFPLFPKLYSRKTKTKIEFATELIEQATQTFRMKEVILDSWYMANEIIKFCLKRKTEVTGCVKSNRKITIGRGNREKLSLYTKGLKRKDFGVMVIDDGTYKIHEKVVRIKSVGFVKLLITKQWIEDKKKWSRPFYLICTNQAKPAVTIIRTYSQRWDIEIFHRDIKQNLGLEAYQVRGRRGIIRHLILAVLSYAVLKFWMCLRNIVWTIGEAIRYIQGKTFDDLIISIVEEDNIEKRRIIAKPFISNCAKV